LSAGRLVSRMDLVLAGDTSDRLRSPLLVTDEN
jgi:hypothetical protein